MFGLLACILVWIVIYQFTWANTFQLSHNLNTIELELEKFESDKQQFGSIPEIELVTQNIADSSDFQHIVLSIIHQICDGKSGQIHEFGDVILVESNKIKVQIQPIVLQGSFFGLLKVLNQLENEYRHLNIASVGFQKEFNRAKKRNELFLKLYIQKVN
jgi:hypothetical protein